MSEEDITEQETCKKCDCNFFNDSILFRLKQESTWRGLITFTTLTGWYVAPDQAEAIVTVGASLVATINIFKRD